jgi:hypothetical protein
LRLILILSCSCIFTHCWRPDTSESLSIKFSSLPQVQKNHHSPLVTKARNRTRTVNQDFQPEIVYLNFWRGKMTQSSDVLGQR